MSSGLILAVLIGLGVAWLWSRVGKRFNVSVNAKHWVVITIIVVAVLLLLYGSSRSAHSGGSALPFPELPVAAV